MGFFDRVKDALTTSDAERAKKAAKEAAEVKARAEEKAQAERAAADKAAAAEREEAERKAELEREEAETRAAAETKAQEDRAKTQKKAAVDRQEVAEVIPGRRARSRTVTVRPGDTLSEIAARHGVDGRAMAEHNRIDNPDLIYPGQVLRIPD